MIGLLAMPTCTLTKPVLADRFALFPFVFVPFVSQLARVAIPKAPNHSEKIHHRITDCPSFAQIAVQHCPIWQLTNTATSPRVRVPNLASYQWLAVEALQIQWLIAMFNQWFLSKQTILVKGDDEPEYFAATDAEPAKIVFAHGFFASSLHEISHWCVAGKKRRALDDFGYWYAPDGRSEEQQQLFEEVEIVPQAIECLLSLACNKPFRVSKDNLFASFDTSQSTFEQDVAKQALRFWQTGDKLPSDAAFLINTLSQLRPIPLSSFAIGHNFVGEMSD
jgi:elongation factor P hydroxylase